MSARLVRAVALPIAVLVVACAPAAELHDGGAAALQDLGVRPDSPLSADAHVGADLPAGTDLAAALDHTAPDHTAPDHTQPDAAAASLGIDPSGGGGGTIAPGQTGDWSCAAGSGHVYVYLPTSYDGAARAAPAIWLFNEEPAQWRAIADADGVILVDLDEYNDIQAYVDKINCAVTRLEQEYNVDRARNYLAGWSAGGNIVVMLGSMNQDWVVATMAFPGTGGQTAHDELAAWSGHKLRLYYACGDQDPSFAWSAVQNEADAFAGLGYTTRFDRVEGCGHYIDEVVYGKRQHAWDWVEGFHLQD